MTMTRCSFESNLRTDCTVVNLATTFDVKKNVRSFQTDIDPSSDVDQQVLTTNLKILEMVKFLESHSKLDMLRQTRGGGCGGRGGTPVRDNGARRGGGPSIRTTSDQSYLWCTHKGHTSFDCPSPPTPALKKVCDDLIVKRATKIRNDDSQHFATIQSIFYG